MTTETPETPVERRLRGLAEDARTTAEAEDIDAGREAIALLGKFVEEGTPWDERNECVFCGERWNPRKHDKGCAWVAANALLTRCGQEGTE